MILSHPFERTAAKARDIRILFDDSQFQQISDRNTEALFFKKFLVYCGFTSIHGKDLACIYHINVENMKKSAALSANMNKGEPADLVARKLSLMIKKSLLSNTCFNMHPRELPLQKESF
jgi:hypothetical protein